MRARADSVSSEGRDRTAGERHGYSGPGFPIRSIKARRSLSLSLPRPSSLEPPPPSPLPIGIVYRDIHYQIFEFKMGGTYSSLQRVPPADFVIYAAADRSRRPRDGCVEYILSAALLLAYRRYRVAHRVATARCATIHCRARALRRCGSMRVTMRPTMRVMHVSEESE